MRNFEEIAPVIYKVFQDYTMIPKERYVDNLLYANWLKTQPDFPEHGAIAECGSWRGGMAAGFIKVFGKRRNYLLYDSFKGLPDVSDKDGEDIKYWKAHPEHPRFFNNCAAPQLALQALMENICATRQVQIVPGWFHETLPNFKPQPMAFVHLDGDLYESTAICLKTFWPYILPGGAIIIDDYHDWEGCRRAVHDFFAENKVREAIDRIGKTGGALVRRLGPWSLHESPHLR